MWPNIVPCSALAKKALQIVLWICLAYRSSCFPYCVCIWRSGFAWQGSFLSCRTNTCMHMPVETCQGQQRIESWAGLTTGKSCRPILNIKTHDAVFGPTPLNSSSFCLISSVGNSRKCSNVHEPWSFFTLSRMSCMWQTLSDNMQQSQRYAWY